VSPSQPAAVVKIDEIPEDTKLQRAKDRLRAACGPLILAAIEDPATVEVMVNPDGTVWQEKLGSHSPHQISKISPAFAMGIITIVAGCLGTVANAENPIVEGEWPLDGSRFAGLCPPVVPAASFALRKKASSIFTLDQYVEKGIMTPEQRAKLAEAVATMKNILIVGGTGSGKTTLINGLIREMTDMNPHQRIITIEDTAELQCAAPDKVQMRTNRSCTMSDLVKATLRQRPDRIIVGEVRDHAANDLLGAWNTGHGGGCATIHANNAMAGLAKLNMLVSMHPNAPQEINKFIAEAVQVVVHIARHEDGRKIRNIVEVKGYYADKDTGEGTFRVISL